MKLYRSIYLKHLSAALYTIIVIGFFIFDLDMNYLIRKFNTCITLKPFHYYSYSKQKKIFAPKRIFQQSKLLLKAVL